MLGRLRAWSPTGWRIAPILTVTMALLTVAFITTITLLDISRTRQIYWEELERRGELLTSQMTVLLVDPIYLGNVEEASKVASVVAGQPDVEYARVFTSDGSMIANTSVPGFRTIGTKVDGLGQRVLTERSTIQERNADALEIAQPVTIGSQLIGGVQIGLRSDTLQRQERAIVIEHVRQGLLLTALAAGIAYVIARQFSRPVTVLVNATNRMAGGRLDTRVGAAQPGELGELAGAFNTMASELQSTVHDLQESRRRIVGAQEDVRREIASHLHGRVQARLLVLRTQLYRMSHNGASEPDADGQMSVVIEQLDDLIQNDITSLSHRLYPSILRRGIVPAIQSLSDHFEGSFEISLDLSDHIVQAERMNRELLPESVKLAAYRIAEDALTNVVKHAAATTVTIQLDMPDPEHLRLSVTDNGKGFDVAQSGRGLGIEAMHDYAGAVGGELTVVSAPNQGTTVTAVLPVTGE